MADIHAAPAEHPASGPFVFLALLLVFIGSIAMWRVRWLQTLVLKPGRSPSEIKAWLYLLALVSGIMRVAVPLTIAILQGWPGRVHEGRVLERFRLPATARAVFEPTGNPQCSDRHLRKAWKSRHMVPAWLTRRVAIALRAGALLSQIIDRIICC